MNREEYSDEGSFYLVFSKTDAFVATGNVKYKITALSEENIKHTFDTDCKISSE